MFRNGFFSFTLSLLLSASLATMALAGSTDSTSTPVLEVTVEQVPGQVFSLSVQDLQDIAVTDVVTSTIWTQGVHKYTGVPLHAILQHLELSGTTIEAIALNDYSVTIPFDTQVEWPIVAFAIDGQPIPRREKGPLWIIYPFDQSPEFRTETIYSRSIWQLNRLNIVE